MCSPGERSAIARPTYRTSSYSCTGRIHTPRIWMERRAQPAHALACCLTPQGPARGTGPHSAPPPPHTHTRALSSWGGMAQKIEAIRVDRPALRPCRRRVIPSCECHTARPRRGEGRRGAASGSQLARQPASHARTAAGGPLLLSLWPQVLAVAASLHV